MNAKLISAALIAVSISVSCADTGNEAFWSVSGGRFHKGADVSPVYFLGTNMWYGPLLASDTGAADMDRLRAELDSLKALGMTNLRVLVGADGAAGVKSKVEPTLQTAPGVYDENVFVGLDRFLAELGKRDMSAVLYINNSWEWSGGYGQYLEWAGEGTPPSTVDTPWDEYQAHNSKFITNDSAKAMFAAHVRNVVSRTNTVTGVPYKDDPAIFSWQIGNEPRCFTSSDTVKAEFAKWLWESAALIKSLDPNHMVSSGSEGSFGCEMDMDLFRKIHSCPDIDYLTIHIWPYNWSWVSADDLSGKLPAAIRNTDDYIDSHIAVAEEFGKPLVVEEFGFPRDGFKFAKGTPVTARDAYYSHIFSRLETSAKDGGPLSGLNFWTWGGMAEQSPESIYWRPGDDYCGDPAQEQQGLNSVYLADSTTIALIRSTVRTLANEQSGN